MQENLKINGELAALAAGMGDWYRSAFKAGRERTKGVESTLAAFLAGAAWARRSEQSGAQQPAVAANKPCDGGNGYQGCQMVLVSECVQCGRREAATGQEPRQVVRSSEWLGVVQIQSLPSLAELEWEAGAEHSTINTL